MFKLALESPTELWTIHHTPYTQEHGLSNQIKSDQIMNSLNRCTVHGQCELSPERRARPNFQSRTPCPGSVLCSFENISSDTLVTACARRLAAVGDAHALGVLSELMQHETAHVRASALESIFALSDPKSPSLMEALTRCLEDGSALVRTAAQVPADHWQGIHFVDPSARLFAETSENPSMVVSLADQYSSVLVRRAPSPNGTRVLRHARTLGSHAVLHPFMHEL